MNLKSILKSLKLNESTISTLLGVGVVIVVGLIVINYFRGLDTGTTLPTGVDTEENENVELPATHTVAEGETLWDIAEIYYDSGYNWVDVQEANELSDPADIETGQELTIPDVPAKLATVEGAESPEPEETTDAEPTDAMASEEPEATPEATPEPTQEPTATPTPEPTEEPQGDVNGDAQTDEVEIAGESYTVVRGDNLWDIAVRAYGSGYEWVNIAQANDLANPDIIHAGNVLVLPR